MFGIKFLPNIEEDSIFKSYFVVVIFLITFVIAALGYFIVEKERLHSQNEIKKREQELITAKKELIKSEVKRVKQYLEIERQNAREGIMSSTKEQTENAYSLIESIYANESQENGKQHTKEEIISTLRKLKFFSGRGYIFIINASSGVWELMPLDNMKEGKSILEYKDNIGNNIFSEVLQKVTKQKSGVFVNYRWYVPKTDKISPKTSYLKYFKPFDWVVGAGDYDEIVEELIKQRAISNISQMRFGADGYSSIYQPDGKIVVVPGVDSLSGENIHKTTTAAGQKAKDIVDTLIRQAQKGGGFYRYDWIKPSSGQDSPKIAYAEEFKEWGLVVASGIYMDDIAKEVAAQKKHIQEDNAEKFIIVLYVFIVAVAFAILLLFVVSISFEKILRYYKASLKQRNIELEELNRTLESKIAVEVAKSEQRQHIIVRQSRLAAMGEMIGNIAHHWRQPLNAVSIIVQDFPSAKAYGELDDKYIETNVLKATTIINELSKTLDNFRNFFAPNRDKEKFSIAAMIDHAIKLLSASFENEKIKIETFIEEDAIINGYPNEFAQVILNILLNSKDAIILNAVKDGIVKIRVFRVDGSIKIELLDNGGGIAPDVINKIFEPYFTTKYKSNGTGLGLYMSKSIIEESMGGKIDIESGKGWAKVTITFIKE